MFKTDIFICELFQNLVPKEIYLFKYEKDFLYMFTTDIFIRAMFQNLF